MGGEAAKPTQHHRHVGPEHAPRDVRLVDHHQAQAKEEVGPPFVAGQDAGVQHVGVGHDQVGVSANEWPLGTWRVAVVDRGPHLRQAQLPHLAQLVSGQCFGGEEV